MKVSPEQRKQLVKDLHLGIRHKQLSEKYGISVRQVFRIIKEEDDE